MLQFLTDDLLGGYGLPRKRLRIHFSSNGFRQSSIMSLTLSGWSINYQPSNRSFRLLTSHKGVAVRMYNGCVYCLLENGMESASFNLLGCEERLTDPSLYLI